MINEKDKKLLSFAIRFTYFLFSFIFLFCLLMALGIGEGKEWATSTIKYCVRYGFPVILQIPVNIFAYLLGKKAGKLEILEKEEEKEEEKDIENKT